MQDWIRFDPPRGRGIALHLGLLLLILLSVALLLGALSQSQPGPVFILLLLLSLGLSLLVPLLVYRLYSLLQSGYWLGRGALRLQWGMRDLTLPFEDILDLAQASELAQPVEAPRWRWPGSVLGLVRDEELGDVEYLASEPRGQVLIGTAERVYVISPAKPASFLSAYKEASERGSLSPARAQSLAPSFFIAQAWEEEAVRRLLLAGGGLAVLLLIVVAFIGPGQETIALGFNSDGQPLALVPGVQLFLLPALNLLFFFANLLLGLAFYRQKQENVLSKLLWGSSLMTGILFAIAIVFVV